MYFSPDKGKWPKTDNSGKHGMVELKSTAVLAESPATVVIFTVLYAVNMQTHHGNVIDMHHNALNAAATVCCTAKRY